MACLSARMVCVPGRKGPALPFPGHADPEQQVCAGNRAAPGGRLAHGGSHFRPRRHAVTCSQDQRCHPVSGPGDEAVGAVNTGGEPKSHPPGKAGVRTGPAVG